MTDKIEVKTVIGKTMVKALAADTEAALAAVAAKYGLQVKVGGGSYTPSSFKPKVEYSTADSEALEFAAKAPLVGLTAEDYGREIMYNGSKKLKLVAINLRASRFPIVGVTPDGARFKLTEDGVLRALAAGPMAGEVS
jgi:hypothetical protein